VTPDLVTEIRSTALDASRAREIERLSEPFGRMRVYASVPSRWFGGDVVLTLPAVHDLLTDEADWDAETWDMDPEGLEELAVTLEWIFEQLPGDLTFQSTWGDPIEHETRVSRSELLDVVRRGEIGTLTRYHVFGV